MTGSLGSDKENQNSVFYLNALAYSVLAWCSFAKIQQIKSNFPSRAFQGLQPAGCSFSLFANCSSKAKHLAHPTALFLTWDFCSSRKVQFETNTLAHFLSLFCQWHLVVSILFYSNLGLYFICPLTMFFGI